MATNPMQRKTRNAFLLGMVIMLVIAAIVVYLLYMKIQSQAEEIEKYQLSTVSVYTLSQDVESGQILTSDMFTLTSVSSSTVPSNATSDITSLLAAYSLGDTDGNSISQAIDSETGNYYYYYYSVNSDGDGQQLKIYENTGNSYELATALIDGNTYYYQKSGESSYTKITFASNSVIAKTDLNANTVITTSLVTTSDDRVTDDLREVEYNVIVLPMDLMTGDYVDIRVYFPDGTDYIVVSKKNVTVPISNGYYVTDTIQMNLSEEEILYLSCAIVESYQAEGAYMYATKYTDAGLQDKADITYFPSDKVLDSIEKDENIVDDAIEGIQKNRTKISDTINSYSEDSDSTSEIEEDVESRIEAREEYLQSLTATATE